MGLIDDLIKIVTNPVVIGGAIELGGNILGAGAENRATEAAISSTQSNAQLVREIAGGERADRQQQLELLLNMINIIRAEEAPFQEAALTRTRFAERALPPLGATIAGATDVPGFPDNPEVSESFRLLRDEGLENIRRRFSPTGSPSSGPAQIAGGRFTAGLTAAEVDRLETTRRSDKQRFIDNLFRQAGFGTEAPRSNVASSIPFLSQSIPSANTPPANISPLLQAQGATRGGLFGSSGKILGQFPSLIDQILKQPKPI